MSILSELIKPAESEIRSGTTNPAQWLIDWVSGGAETSSGVKVTESSALKYTPFWAAVRVISGTIAALPFLVYQRINNSGKERIMDHPVYKLLHDRPNAYMDAVTFMETRQAQVLTYGNGFAEIQRDGGGRPIALWPLLPDKTERKIDDNGVPYYQVGDLTGKTVNLADYNVLHIKGLGFDGYTGYNVVAHQKEAIGYGKAVKEYGSRFFGNSANPGGVLEHPNTLSDAAKKYLEKTWIAKTGGLSNAHRIRILEEGMKWTATGVNPEQAQALEVQKYTVDDCSRIFNIPPHKLGSLERATFSNIEEQNLDFVAFTMYYWFRKWEQECNYKLFMPSEQNKLFCELLVDGLLRGKVQDRYNSYRSGRQWGWLSINDIRRMENMNPIGPEGDIYLEPLNMKPAGTPSPNDKPLPNQDVDDDKTKNAHYILIEGQWSRIIHKHLSLLANNPDDYSYYKMQDYAEKVLLNSIYAYASIFGHIKDKIRLFLNEFIRQNINPDKKLQPDDAARLTNEIITKFNGDKKCLIQTSIQQD